MNFQPGQIIKYSQSEKHKWIWRNFNPELFSIWMERRWRVENLHGQTGRVICRKNDRDFGASNDWNNLSYDEIGKFELADGSTNPRESRGHPIARVFRNDWKIPENKKS